MCNIRAALRIKLVLKEAFVKPGSTETSILAKQDPESLRETGSRLASNLHPMKHKPDIIMQKINRIL